MPAFRKPAEKLFTKIVVSKGIGINTPQDGSVCIIKFFLDNANLLSGLDENKYKQIIINDADEVVDQIIEDCVKTMKEKEVCCIEFLHQKDFVTNKRPLIRSSDKKNMNKGKEVACEYTGSMNFCASACDATNSSDNIGKITSIESSLMETEFGKKLYSEPGELAYGNNYVTPNLTEMFSNNTILNAEADCSLFDIQSNKVKLQFQLLSFTAKLSITEMNASEKWHKACYHKQKAMDLYSEGNYEFAFKQFGLALKYIISLEHDVPSNKKEEIDIIGLKHSCYLNLSACQFKHKNFECVVINCSKALTIQANNAKALYRRGVAYMQLQEYEKAKDDLIAAQQLEPDNKAVIKQLQLLKCQVRNLNQFYASVMKKMFS